MPISQVRVLLNADAGTLRGRDAQAVAETTRSILSERWPDVDVTLSSRRRVADDLDRLLADKPDVLVVGGGDGTINGAIAKAIETNTTVGVLPLGTMNLVARDLSIPLALEEAVAALSRAEPIRISVGLVNDRVFVSYVSIGIHAWMVRRRDAQSGQSKWAKRLATLRWSVSAWWASPRQRLRITTRDEDVRTETTMVVVANTPFADGTSLPPRRDDLTGRDLAIYIAKDPSRTASLRLAAEVLAGRWNENAELQVTVAPMATVTGARSRLTCAVDGELHQFDGGVRFRLLPESVSVLVPTP